MIERPGGPPAPYNGGGGANGGYAAHLTHLTAEEPAEFRRAALSGRVSPSYLGQQHHSGSRQRSSRWENGVIGDGGAGKDGATIFFQPFFKPTREAERGIPG